MKPSSLCVCLPAFNDEHTIGPLVKRAVALLEQQGMDYEIVVVNDGSRDRTGAVLEALAQQCPRLRVIHHAANHGYGAAVRAAVAAATKEFIFYTDSDGQYDITELARLLPHAEAATLVNGYKIRRSDPWYRHLVGASYACLARWCYGVRLRDVDCDFRLMPTAAVQGLALEARHGALGVELVVKLQRVGCRIVEVPVHHYPRRFGRSQFFRWASLVTTGSELWRLWWRLHVVRVAERQATMVASHASG